MSAAPSSADRFREQALAEVRRYGTDPWIAVRELLQNARDAGATSVSLRTEIHDGSTRLSCRDDGHGLTFDDAQRDLFTLYASRKRGRDAGRFGVGFWSILLLEPTRIVVRSWPRRGTPWEASWDGALGQARRARPPAGTTGTEVVLELRAPEGVAESVHAAAWRHARFLRRRDGRAPLAVTVDGRGASAPFELPAPSLAFHRHGLRGVVALGTVPRVELFAKGLLVRVAASLDDLLAPGARSAARPLAPGLPGLSPRFLLDSDDLDLLLSRGDARSDGALARVVATAREELDRLLDRQLARSGRRPWRFTGPRVAAALGAVVTGVGLSALLAPRAFSERASSALTGAPARIAVADASGSAAAAPLPVPAPVPYRDPGAGYAGPILDPLDHEPRELALRYAPADRTLHLAVLRIESFDADGRPRVARQPEAPYEAEPCAADCVAFELQAAGPSWTALPVPTGHRLDPSTLSVEGRPVTAWATPADEPMVRLDGRPVTVRYRTGPAAEPGRDVAFARRPPERPAALPAVLEPGRRATAAVPLFERPTASSGWVRAHVRDSRAREVALRFAAAARGGQDFARTAIELGAGDCDVQNGIVTRLLQATGVPARLAVGYLGLDGRAIPGLHAWVEHRADGARWSVTDASLARAEPRARPASPPSAPALLAPGAPAPSRRSMADGRSLPGRTWALSAAALALMGLGVRAAWTRPRRAFRLAGTTDVLGILRGALRSPETATRVPALMERALIPRWDGGRASLAQAQDAAAGRRLFLARRAAALAQRAREEGGLVLDGQRPEARAVADALAAVDLDGWQDRLDAPLAPALTRRANRYLDWAGERWRVQLGSDVGAPRILDLPRSRVLLLEAGEEWRDASDGTGEPTVRSLVAQAAALLGLSPERRALLLAPLDAAATEGRR